MEWSFKKAITIQTYSSCHPIPVPINLVSFMVKCCGWQKCFSRLRNRRQQMQTARVSLFLLIGAVQVFYLVLFHNLYCWKGGIQMERLTYKFGRNQPKRCCNGQYRKYISKNGPQYIKNGSQYINYVQIHHACQIPSRVPNSKFRGAKPRDIILILNSPAQYFRGKALKLLWSVWSPFTLLNTDICFL